MRLNFAGMTVLVVDAQMQARTAKDVRGVWVRPRCYSKAADTRHGQNANTMEKSNDT